MMGLHRPRGKWYCANGSYAETAYQEKLNPRHGENTQPGAVLRDPLHLRAAT